MRGSRRLSCGRENRPEWVSCRPTKRSSSEPKPSRWAVRQAASRSARPGGCWRGEGLVGIRPAVGLDRGGFATPNPLRAAQAEVPPATQCVGRRRAVGIGVPAFHRMNAPAIADRKAADVERRRQRRAFRRGQNPIVDRQLKPQLRQPGTQSVGVLELGDFGEGGHGKAESRRQKAENYIILKRGV